MSSKIEYVRTPAIASNAATVESDMCFGLVMEIRVDVRTSAGAASSNTCTVTITDNLFGRTILTEAGVTGASNFFDPASQWQDNGATNTGLYKPFTLVNQRFTVAITNGTNTEYVEVWVKIL